MQWAYILFVDFSSLRWQVRLVTAAVMMVMGAWCTAVAADDPATHGAWSHVVDAQILPTHMNVLPTGKILYWNNGDIDNGVPDPFRLWDWLTHEISTPVLIDDNLYCSGHSFTSDGELLITGGHDASNGDLGLKTAGIYNPFTNLWTRTSDMNAGRYYPTNTTLSGGDVLVVAGSFKEGVEGNNILPQVWQNANGTWRDLTNAQRLLPWYPFMFLAPNGQVFNAGPNQDTGYLDTTGQGGWTPVASSHLLSRADGSAVMYDQGKVMIVGGAEGTMRPTKTAEIIDLNAASPTWQFTKPMAYARHFHNAILLPDGKVFVVGGTSSAGLGGRGAVLTPELWNPVTGQWSSMAPMQTKRLYHATASLLPDGRVIVGGGGRPARKGEDYPHNDFEIYSPPYLFNGIRPTILSAPPDVTYGQTFFVQTPEAADIRNVNWIRLSSVTHGFDQNQRINHLNFSQAPDGLNVTVPSSGNLSPPGHYMLFILNRDGVPSVATIIRVASDNAGDSRLTVTLSGTGSGTVTSNPEGINCPLICTTIFLGLKPLVTLTATPDAGSFFVGWSGHPDCSDDIVTMNIDKICTATFTHGVKPTLTVIKTLIPNNDLGLFQLRIDGAIIVSNVGDGGTTGVVALNPGPHAVREIAADTNTVLANYVRVIGGDCAADGTITLELSDQKICTITNTRKPTLTVNKILIPGDDPGLFNLLTNGGIKARNVGNGGTTGAMIRNPGYVKVSESAGTNTRLADYTSVIGGDCATNGAITLAPGDNKICTITNTRKPTLTVIKTLIPNNDYGKFQLRIDGKIPNAGANNVGDGGTTGAVSVIPGSHTVRETAADTDTILANYIRMIGGDCAADGTITLAFGDNKICTITNTRKPTLTVNKILIPDDDPGLFNLWINGVTRASNVNNGGTTGVMIRNPGIVIVSETAGTNTRLTNYTSVIGGDCATNGAITLAPGDNKICTITNTRKLTLTVIKTLIPNNDYGKFQLRIDGKIPNAGANNVGDGGTTGAVSVIPGSHTVRETAADTDTILANYIRMIGGDCAADGTITLAFGDNKICTITNTRKPTLTVNKILIPDDDTGKFNLRINGVIKGSNVGDGGTTGAVIRNPGFVTVDEISGTGTSLSNYVGVIGGDCALDGTITLAPGDNKICTITNTRKPTLTVIKMLIPSDDTGLFNLRINGVIGASNVGNGGTTGAILRNPGFVTVDETAGTGTYLGSYERGFSGDCAANGTVILAFGDNKTCTITNTRKPTLTVIKMLVPSDDPGLFNLRMNGVITATDVGNNGTTGAVVRNPGPVTVDETAGTGTILSHYTSVFSGDCAANGAVTLALGDNKTCTIINTRK